MTAIQTETFELTDTTAGWAGHAPTQFGLPPVAAPALDAISAAAHAALAGWPAAHEGKAGERATNAAELAAANGGTAGILTATEGSNAALIAQSVEG